MYIGYTKELHALRNELRGYFSGLLTAAERVNRDIYSGERYRDLIRTLGADGWLGIGWPVEFGGQGRSALEQFVFFDEAKRAGMPIPMLALDTVGPTLMAHGSASQKAWFLPRILSGEIDFAVGYTEPDAGTDLTALRTRAVWDGNNYVINGSKVFTTGGAMSDFIWLAARTDPDAPRHAAMSIFIVPTDARGFRVTPLPTIAEDGARATTSTYYEDVVVSEDLRIGAENAGWRLITAQLNHERVALAAARGWIFPLAADVLEWAQTNQAPDGRLMIEHDWVRIILARVEARLEAMKLLNWQMVALAAHGDGPNAADASTAKIYGTEVLIEVSRLLLDVLGPAGYVVKGSSAAILGGRIEQAYRSSVVGTFGGGNNDVLREMIATQALGMVRSRR